MGTKIGMVKIFFKIQKLWQNRRRANGIRVEYFPRIQYVAAQWRSQTFTVQIRWDTREFHRKNPIYVDVQWHFLLIKKTTKNNVWQIPNSYLCTRGDLEKDNGHLLVLVLKRNGAVSVKTVHKEYRTILLKGCCWNLLKADVQFPRYDPNCPEVNWKAKDMENCRYTMQPIWKRLKLFFA